MVNRHARDVAAQALQEFLDGAISNDEYESRYPLAEDDRALVAIFTQVWFLYSDIREHRLTGKHAPGDQNRALLERCILFLRSDLEYMWPRNDIRLSNGILRLIGLGKMLERRADREWSIGVKEVWPFLNRPEFEEAASKVGGADI